MNSLCWWRKQTKAIVLIFLVILSITLPHLNYAQSAQGLNTVTIPPTPDAAALGAYIDNPVSLATGSVQIPIPLWTLSGRNIQLPISLNYHSSGIRVDEIASRIGLGWALNAGGVISRTVHGMPDEVPGGFFATFSQLPTPAHPQSHTATPNNYSSQELEAIERLAEGVIDGQPDKFTVSFPGGNFTIIFDNQGNPHTIPYSLVEITVDWNSNTWAIRTPDGIRYTFGNNAIESSQTSVNSHSLNIAAVSAWYLTQIEDPFGDEITIDYEVEGNVCQNIPESQTEFRNINGGECGNIPQARTWGSSCTDAIRIKEINSSLGSASFVYALEGRTDNPPSKALREVHVVSGRGDTIRSFRLEHSYWSNRLMLDRVIEYVGDQAKPAHEFTYDRSANMPQPGSFHKDHWGYYNGKTNTTLVPKTEFGDCMAVGSADREPDFNFGKLGLLSQLGYPTGGHTRFEYEPHTVWSGPSGRQYQAFSVLATSSCSDQAPNCSGSSAPSLGTASFSLTHAQCVQVHISASNSAGNPCGVRIKIVATSSNQAIATWQCISGIQKIFLPLGSYEVQLQSLTGGDTAQAIVHYEKETVGGFNREIGGLRLARMIIHDGESSSNDMIREYVYEGEQQPGQSSGVLVREPYYIYEFEEVIPSESSGQGLPTPHARLCLYHGVQASARSLYGNGGGSHIHYGRVKTNFGTGGSNGYTLQKFTTAQNHPDPGMDFPFGLEKSKNHLRGMPLYSGVFDASGKKVSEEFTEYSYRNENRTLIAGAMAAFKRIYIGLTVTAEDEVVIRPFNLESEWFHVAEIVSRSYDDNGVDYVETSQIREYANPAHIQLTARRSTDSEGRELISRMRYPEDYPAGGNDAASLAIQKLRDDQFRWAIPLESTQWQKVGNGNEELLGGSLMLYKEFAPKVVQPERLLVLETPEPISNFSSSTIAGNVLSYDLRYSLEEEALAYTDLGQLVEAKEKNGISSGFLWGYGGALPVAQVSNGSIPLRNGNDSGPVINGSCSYTGFETGNEMDHDPDEGYWTFQSANSSSTDAHTGLFAREIQAGTNQYGPIRELRPDPQEGTITFSAWVKTPANYAGGKLVLHTKEDNGNSNAIYPPLSLAPSRSESSIPAGNDTWQYISTSLDLDAIRSQGNIPANEQLRIVAYLLNHDSNHPVLVDDLRIQPEDARMITRTYEPLIGTSSELDANNQKKEFVYDALFRLEEVKDHRDLLRSLHDYQYQRAEIYPVSNAINNTSSSNSIITFSAPVTIDATSSNWTWDFGDGSSQTTSQSGITHSYSNSGSYSVNVSVSDQEGRSASQSFIITVSN